MSKSDAADLLDDERDSGAEDFGDESAERGTGKSPIPTAQSAGGFFQQYKPEQGKATRVGSYVAAGTLVAWGMVYLYNRLTVYEGDESWRLLVTVGIPIAFAVVVGWAAWWAIFGRRDVGDFMIATEGEMKKVNWSTRKEIIGSTKVVIVFTILLALIVFFIDVAFQALFTAFGVLKA